MTGIPAMLEYPITSGMASAASVRPASASAPSRDRLTGRTPWRKEIGNRKWRSAVPAVSDISGGLHVTGADRPLERRVIVGVLVGVRLGERCHGVVEHVAGPEVAGDGGRVAGTGVGA